MIIFVTGGRQVISSPAFRYIKCQQSTDRFYILYDLKLRLSDGKKRNNALSAAAKATSSLWQTAFSTPPRHRCHYRYHRRHRRHPASVFLLHLRGAATTTALPSRQRGRQHRWTGLPKTREKEGKA